MRVLLPSEGLDVTVSDTFILNTNETHRESLDRQYRSAAPEHAQLVALLLPIEDRPRGEGDNPGLNSLPFEFRSSLEGDGDLTSTTDNCEVLTLHLVYDVSTLGRPLDRRSLKVGKILAGKGEDGGSGLRLESDKVSSGGFVTVGGTPDVDVGSSTEVSKSLDRLVGRTVLSKTDRIMGGNPDDLVATQSGKPNGTSGVRDKVLS